MANTATLIDTVPVIFKNNHGPVYEYEIAIDTIDTDLTVRANTINPLNRIWLVGALLSEGTALNLTFKTATKTETIELAANQGIYDKVSGGYIFVTKPGEDFVIRSSAIIGSTVGKNLNLKLIEAQSISF